MRDRIFRYWTYFRLGYSYYLTVPLGIVSTATVIYYLLIKDIPGLLTLFPRFEYFLVVGLGFILLLGIAFGRFHYYSKAWKKDNQVAIETNPYTFKTQPGLSQDLQIPTQILILKTMRKIADEKDLPTYDYFIHVWEEIQKGKDVREIISQ